MIEYADGLRVAQKDGFYKVFYRWFELAHVQVLTTELLEQLVRLQKVNGLFDQYENLRLKSIVWRPKGWLDNKNDQWVFQFEYGGIHGVYVERAADFDHSENSFALDYFQPEWIPGVIEEGKEKLRTKCDYPLDDYPLQ